MNINLKKEIIQYLRERHLVKKIVRQERTEVPLKDYYEENDLCQTPAGEYYSKKEVLGYLSSNGYELTQSNFDIAARHCYIPHYLDSSGVPYISKEQSFIGDGLENVSDEDLETYLTYALLREHTAPVIYYEYKVVKLLDTFVLGKTKSEELQNILNDHASKGWRLKSASVNQITNILSSSERDEMILIFERKKEYTK